MVEVGYFILGLLIGAGMCWVLAPLCRGFVQGFSEARLDGSGGGKLDGPLRSRSDA